MRRKGRGGRGRKGRGRRRIARRRGGIGRSGTVEEKSKKGKGGKEGDEVQEVKGGKIKARIDVGRQPEGLGGEGPEDGGAITGAVKEEVGIVIHDDD